MEDSKFSSKLVPFGKTQSKDFTFEKQAAAHGDSKSPSEKDDTVESLSSESTQRSRKRTYRAERKIPSDVNDDEVPQSILKKKKKNLKEDAATSEESSEIPKTQKQKEPEKKTDTRVKIKSFASKGAAAKSVDANQAPKSAAEEARRRIKSSILQSRIQPTEDKTNQHLPSQTSRNWSEPKLPEQNHKRKSEIMQEEMSKAEQEEQTLANFVLNLVKRKGEEKEEEAQIALSETEIFEKSRNMSPLEEAGIVCILEEAVAKLGFTHTKPVVKQEIKYVSILDKLADKEDSEFVDAIKSNKSPEEHHNEKRFIKLQKDRGFLEEALNLTLLEMKERRSFKILQDIVHLEEEMTKEEADLRFIGKCRQQEVNHCKALMENDRRKTMKKLDDRTALLALLKDEIQDMLYYNGFKFRYMDHWESSRAEQNAMMLQNKEKDLDRQLLDYEQMTNIEIRCSAEIKALIEEDIKNLADKVEEWMSKYETEMEDREYKLSKLKKEREEHLKQLKDKTDVFHERQRQIVEWKAYKERLRLEAEHKALLIRMATHIQAWWRGTMVRRRLGPLKKLKLKHGKRHRKKKKK